MLIRLANHHVLNPHLIDKLIVVRGLPFEWIFKKVEQGDQLLPPWEADNDVNIPESIRHLCTPITYCRWFPDIRHYDKTYVGFWDTRTVLGLALDYGRGPGQEMWNKIEDYIQGTILRTEKMPVPVLVAPDQKSDFSPRLAKRSESGGGIQLHPAKIPVIDLNVYKTPVIQVQPATVTAVLTPTPVVAMQPPIVIPLLSCPDCDFQTQKPQALRMHTTKKHPKKEKVMA